MNKHLPSKIKPCPRMVTYHPSHRVRVFLRSDLELIKRGQRHLVYWTQQSAPTLAQVKLNAANEYTDAHDLPDDPLSLVSTRDGRFYVNGKELVVRLDNNVYLRLSGRLS